MTNIRTGKEFDEPSMTRGGFIRGGLASIIAAKSAPYIALGAATLAGKADASLRRGIGARLATNFGGESVDTYLDYAHIGSGQFFDPNITICQGRSRFDSVEASLRVTSICGEWDWYFGGWNSSLGKGTFIRRANTNSYVNVGCYCFGTPQQDFTSEVLPYSQFKTASWRRQVGGWCEVNFGSSKSSWYTFSSSYDCPFVVGALKLPSGFYNSGSEFDLSYIVIKQDSSTVTNRFLPVIHEGRVCFKDENTGIYHYNQGTGGDFTAPV